MSKRIIALSACLVTTAFIWSLVYIRAGDGQTHIDASSGGGYLDEDSRIRITDPGSYLITQSDQSISGYPIVVSVDGEADLTIVDLKINSDKHSPLDIEKGNVKLLLKGDNVFNASVYSQP
ncbi:MAG: hypothetical protein LBC41_12145 [Clostridiales bacterium]|nr:hypothetical protein [Clostridiales bacterium]MDR2751403.1 hypothetical protein [Clostridiales bacterium]